MTTERLKPFIPAVLDGKGSLRPLAEGHLMPADDLFGSAVSSTGNPVWHPGFGAIDGDHAAFVLPGRATVSVDLRSVRPAHVQCLLAAIERSPTIKGAQPLRQQVVDTECGLTLWAGDKGQAVEVTRLWSEIKSAGDVGKAAILTTPSLYGNKLRLTGFIAPVATVSVPPGAPILDLMSGTGVVARALASRHPISVNDANPYAALLSRTQGIDGNAIDVSAIAQAIRGPYATNLEALTVLVGERIQEEAALLHGDVDADGLQAFANFNALTLLPVTDGGGRKIARLFTERYANVYFGLSQSMEIDSLRLAIDHGYPEAGPERDLCLAALVIACTACASGPHFAQPARAKSLRSLRTILERRARSVAWEFELALGRLVSRPNLNYSLASATCGGWRDALDAFATANNGASAGVYVDPPYSKLQYSRYYHVLNVLLAYDYPTVTGTGRYPPREQRFSSRFEYQPGMARRELSDLVKHCAARGLTTMISYGDAGFVGIETLISELSGSFQRVEVFTEALRHHSQGRIMASARHRVLEHVLVGRPT